MCVPLRLFGPLKNGGGGGGVVVVLEACADVVTDSGLEATFHVSLPFRCSVSFFVLAVSRARTRCF